MKKLKADQNIDAVYNIRTYGRNLTSHAYPSDDSSLSKYDSSQRLIEDNIPLEKYYMNRSDQYKINNDVR